MTFFWHDCDICKLTETQQNINTKFEPRHEISNNVVCATSKASDQPAHTVSLIRAFASSLDIPVKILHADRAAIHVVMKHMKRDLSLNACV